jgi:hypothetical protein
MPFGGPPLSNSGEELGGAREGEHGCGALQGDDDGGGHVHGVAAPPGRLERGDDGAPGDGDGHSEHVEQDEEEAVDGGHEAERDHEEATPGRRAQDEVVGAGHHARREPRGHCRARRNPGAAGPLREPRRGAPRQARGRDGAVPRLPHHVRAGGPRPRGGAETSGDGAREPHRVRRRRRWTAARWRRWSG